jgi:hypothetical protein
MSADGSFGKGRCLRNLVFSIISSDICDFASDQGYRLIPEETCGYVPTVSFRYWLRQRFTR